MGKGVWQCMLKTQHGLYKERGMALHVKETTGEYRKRVVALYLKKQQGVYRKKGMALHIKDTTRDI